MDVVDDFALAADDHIARITLAENVHSLVACQGDVIGERMLL